MAELEQVQQVVLGLAVAKPVGMLTPAVVDKVSEVVLSKTVSWASHAFEKAKVLSKLTVPSDSPGETSEVSKGMPR